jgi:diaminopropionate ammonia-lyase
VTERVVRNPMARPGAVPIAPTRAPIAVHRRLPDYAPTPLVDAAGLAHALGVGRVLVKVEAQRIGLPAFKMLGASWATYCTLVERLGHEPDWQDVDELATAFAALRPLTLVAATDGNHGRAVARMAKLLGLDARIFVPSDMAPARIAGIESEGATVEIVAGSYDDAVARSAHSGDERTVIVSDTSWEGYTEIPERVIAGYSTIFFEIEDDLAHTGRPPPDLVFVPAGVGALAAATVAFFRRTDGASRPTIVCVEPEDAACVLESCLAGVLTSVPGPHRSIMVGLNCGNASPVAWPVISRGIDWCTAVADERAEEGMRLLATEGVEAGETGAASLAGALAVTASPERDMVGLRRGATVLLLCTEGATDPVNYERIVGRPPELALHRSE